MTDWSVLTKPSGSVPDKVYRTWNCSLPRSDSSVSLPSIEWYISGGWKDANFAWEDETRNWEHIGMLGKDSD